MQIMVGFLRQSMSHEFFPFSKPPPLPMKWKHKSLISLVVLSFLIIFFRTSMADCRMEKPWGGFLCLFSIKSLHISARREQLRKEKEEISVKKRKKMRYCSGSLCGCTKVMQRAFTRKGSPEFYKKRAFRFSSSNSIADSSISTRSMKSPLYKRNGSGRSPLSTSFSFSSSASSSATYSAAINGGSGSLGAIPSRKFSGCYESKTVMDPILGYTKDLSFRSSIFPCPMCGEIFMKSENLELHQATSHAVSELDPEDTSRKIVEIIFKSSWMKKEPPTCKIERILKVHNTQKTISNFEEHRDAVKAKATKLQKKHPRCLADGNELLRFHCTTIACPLGVNGSTELCHATHPPCSTCSIIRGGFKAAEKGILTTATSGAADDRAGEAVEGNEKRAMMVCRVVAGRVKRSVEAGMEYDSVSGGVGVYSSLDELYVFNPKAILPCFVVIYEGLNA